MSQDCPVTRLYIFSLAGCRDLRWGLFSLSAMINLRPYHNRGVLWRERWEFEKRYQVSSITHNMKIRPSPAARKDRRWKPLDQSLFQSNGPPFTLIWHLLKSHTLHVQKSSPTRHFQVIVVHTGKPPPPRLSPCPFDTCTNLVVLSTHTSSGGLLGSWSKQSLKAFWANYTHRLPPTQLCRSLQHIVQMDPEPLSHGYNPQQKKKRS